MEEMLAPGSTFIRDQSRPDCEIMQRAYVGIVASGSATLEAAYFSDAFRADLQSCLADIFGRRLLVKVKYLACERARR